MQQCRTEPRSRWSPTLSVQGSKWWDPNFGIQMMGSKWWDLNNGIQMMGSKWWDPNEDVKKEQGTPRRYASLKSSKSIGLARSSNSMVGQDRTCWPFLVLETYFLVFGDLPTTYRIIPTYTTYRIIPTYHKHNHTYIHHIQNHTYIYHIQNHTYIYHIQNHTYIFHIPHTESYLHTTYRIIPTYQPRLFLCNGPSQSALWGTLHIAGWTGVMCIYTWLAWLNAEGFGIHKLLQNSRLNIHVSLCRGM